MIKQTLVVAFESNWARASVRAKQILELCFK